MSFTPRTPTFHLLLVIHQWDSVLGLVTREDPLPCQVYTPLRTADDTIGNLLYLVYPKEDDALRGPVDLSDGGFDVVDIPYPPGGSTKHFRVRDVLPRWLGFPNQHLIASLVQMTQAAFDSLVPTPPAPEEIDIMNSTSSAACDCTVFDSPSTLVKTLDTPTAKVWETTLPFDCPDPGDTVAVVVTYQPGNGLLRATYTRQPSGETLAEYEATTLGWDMATTVFLGRVGAGVNACTWAVSVELTP